MTRSSVILWAAKRDRFCCILMEVQDHQEAPEEMATITNELLEAIIKDAPQNDGQCLKLFLTKIYKNNVSVDKPKRMNSMRLNRFSAFLYRATLKYPTESLANDLLLLALMAALNNHKNFQEEEDEQAVISITRWAGVILKLSTQHGFYISTHKFLRFLLKEQKPDLPSSSQYEQALGSEKFFDGMELSAQDEWESLKDGGVHSLAMSFNPKEYLLAHLDLENIYGPLFREGSQLEELMELFRLHLAQLSVSNRRAVSLFMNIFLKRDIESIVQLQLVFDALQDHYLSYEDVKKIVSELLTKTPVTLLYQLKLRGNKSEEIFFEVLSEHYKNKDLEPLVETFLNHEKVSNLIALYLISNSSSKLPYAYTKLLSPYSTMKYQHCVVATIAIAQHSNKNLPSELIEFYFQGIEQCDPADRALIVQLVHYSLTANDRKGLLFSISKHFTVEKFNTCPALEFVPKGEPSVEKLSKEDRQRLKKLLMQHEEEGQNNLPQRIELYAALGFELQMTDRIQKLNSLFSRPLDEILHKSLHQIKTDRHTLSIILMGLNNRLETAYMQDLSPATLNDLVGLFISSTQQLQRKFEQIQTEPALIQHSKFLAALGLYNATTGKSLGCGQIGRGALLKGQATRSRLNDNDFTQYFLAEESMKGLDFQIENEKVIFFESRALVRKLVNFDKGSSNGPRREAKKMLQPEWEHILAFKVIQSYVDADNHLPGLLKDILKTFKPSFEYFQLHQKIMLAEGNAIDVIMLLPRIMRHIYVDTIEFMAQLIESEPARKVAEGKSGRKKTKKSTKEKEKTDNTGQNTDDSQLIWDSSALFASMDKHNCLRFLFGPPAQLKTFTPLIKILSKVQDDEGSVALLLNNWLSEVRIFHCARGQEHEWRQKLASYCALWKLILGEKKYRIQLNNLDQHFTILSQLLNSLYESRVQDHQLEGKVLFSLLLVYQASLANCMYEDQRLIPIQSLRNALLDFTLPIAPEQCYYQCHACELPICQTCVPFLHKHHDITYTGKDGFCCHDAGPKKPAKRSAEPNEREPNRYESLSRNIFGAANFLSNTNQLGRGRREEDSIMHHLELGEQDQDLIENIRFKEMLEMRMREQRERQRQREVVIMRDRQRGERNPFQKEPQPEAEKQEEMEPKVQCEIKSTSAKSIKNIAQKLGSQEQLEPEFDPGYEHMRSVKAPLNTRSLRNILMRQLEEEGSDSSQSDTGKVTVDSNTQRYNFFNKSQFFRLKQSPEASLRSSMGGPNRMLCSNKKFMAYPSSQGVVILSINNLVSKFTRRQSNKNFSDFEQQRTCLINSISNNNINFDVHQLVFSRVSHNILAVVGLTQFGFVILNNDGKIQKFLEGDHRTAEPIVKMMWGSHRKNTYIMAAGNSIRVGLVTDELRVRTASRFKVQIDRPIKDFELVSELGIPVIYVLDDEGCLYRSEFDYRQSRSLNISDRKLRQFRSYQLQALVFIDKRLFASTADGKCHLFRSDPKNSTLALLHSYNINNAISSHPSLSNRGPLCLTSLQLIHRNERGFSLACLMKKTGDSKKRSGMLGVVRVSEKYSMQVILLTQDESVDNCEVNQLGEGNYIITAVDEQGTVCLHHYSVPSELLSQKDEIKISMNDLGVEKCCEIMRDQRLLRAIKYSDPRRHLMFKQHKEITSAYKVIQSPQSLTFKSTYPFRFFILGLSWVVIPPQGKPGHLSFDMMGHHYDYTFEKQREIQLPLTIRETLDWFTNEAAGEQILWQTCEGAVAEVRIWGVEYSADGTSWRKAFNELHRLVAVHMRYSPSSLVYYIENSARVSLAEVNLNELANLKQSHKYSQKDLNFLMKLQLLRQATSDSLSGEKQVQETLTTVLCSLMPMCERRHFLQRSCTKLVRAVCEGASEGSQGRIGHPLEHRTALDLYHYQRHYGRWALHRNLASFEQLVHFLYSLIFQRIGNLYLILQLHPDLIYELTYAYKTWLGSLRSNSEGNQQSQLTKLTSICANYVAIICEYYQTLKNSANHHKKSDNSRTPEKIVLQLLEEVFCASRKELYRQIFISPEMYLQRLHLVTPEERKLGCAVDVFGLQLGEHTLQDHAERKASLHQQDIMAGQEEEIQLEEESDKQMMEEEVREMGEGQKDKAEPDQSQQPQGPILEKMQAQKVRRVTSQLLGHLVDGEGVKFVYYQFSLEMVTALFRLNDYLTDKNCIFYMGILFNFLRIIEGSLEPVRDKHYLDQFYAAVHNSLNSPQHAPFYLVLKYFFEPSYSPEKEGTRDISPSSTQFSQHMLHYYEDEGLSLESIFKGVSLSRTYLQTVSLGEAMKMQPFKRDNQLYQLKFLGNLYLNWCHFKPSTPTEAIKPIILSGVVKYQLRVFKNIMNLEGWQGDLQRAKVDVGFNTLNEDEKQGVSMLYECAISNPKVFNSKLSEEPERLAALQGLLSENDNTEQLLEMLTVYYDS